MRTKLLSRIIIINWDSNDGMISESSRRSLVQILLQFRQRIRLLPDFLHQRKSIDSVGNQGLQSSNVIGNEQIDPSERITDEMTIRSVVLKLSVLEYAYGFLYKFGKQDVELEQ